MRRRFKDETGKVYRRLTVSHLDGIRKGQPYFACKCVCGNNVSIRGANLRSGNTKSCGCSRRKAPVRKRKLAMQIVSGSWVVGRADDSILGKNYWITSCKFCRRTNLSSEVRIRRGKGLLCDCLKGTYTSWRKMIERCSNRNHDQYMDYGGRGIVVCMRWRESFHAFVDDMGRRPPNKTMDRQNNDGGYEPSNCRWATSKEQVATRRRKGVSQRSVS
jgi:hypothetical protein